MSKYTCPICEQYMDLIVISHRNKPFVDGSCYQQMCFGCYHTPKSSVQEYDENQNLVKEEIQIYNHRNLNTAEELYENGSVSNLEEGKKCVSSVKNACKRVGIKNLDKLKLKKPDPEYALNPVVEAKRIEYAKSLKKKKTKKQDE